MSSEISNNIYIHYIKIDKFFRNFMRSKEIFNLVAGRTKIYLFEDVKF